MAELRVAARFRGPPGVANGGFASGSLAALLGGAAEVTLRRPLPLDRPLPVRGEGDGSLVVEDGGVLLAEARPAEVPVELLAVPAAVTTEAAEAVAGRALWAAPWTPDTTVAGTDGRVRPEVVWAALDCPSGIAAADAADLPAGAVLAAARTVWITVAQPAVAPSAGAVS